MGQTRLLQKFRRFISLNAVLEKAEAFLQKSASPQELAKFTKDLEEFKEEQVNADYTQFLNQQPKFKEFLQRQVIAYHARKLTDLLKNKIPDRSLDFQNEYAEYLSKPHTDLDKDFIHFCANSEKGYLTSLEIEGWKDFYDTYDIEMHHIEHELTDLREGYCFGLSITDALLKDWAKWEERIKEWNGKYSELQPRQLPESKTNVPEDLRDIISLAIQYVIPSQAGYALNIEMRKRGHAVYMPDTMSQADFLRPEAHVIKLPESKLLSSPPEEIKKSFLEISVLNKETKKYEIRSVQRYKIITGDFSDTLSDVLDENLATGKNIFLIGPLRHACRFSYEDGVCHFYDPNEDKRISGKKDIVKIIQNKFGTALQMRVASFDSEHDLAFSKYDELLRDSPYLLLQGKGLHVMAAHSQDTLLELLKRAKTEEKLSSAIGNALPILDEGNKSGLQRIWTNTQLRQDFLKLISTNPSLRIEIIKAMLLEALMGMVHTTELRIPENYEALETLIQPKEEDALEAIPFIVAIIDSHISQLQSGYGYPTVLFPLSESNIKSRLDGSLLGSEQGMELMAALDRYRTEFALRLEFAISLTREEGWPSLAYRIVKDINEIQYCLPQSPGLADSLLRVAKKIEIQSPEHSKILIETIANIIESKEMFSELMHNSQDDYFFVMSLIQDDKSEGGKRIKKAIQTALTNEDNSMSQLIVEFCKRKDNSFYFLFRLADDDIEFANSLTAALLKGIPKTGTHLIVEESAIGLASLLRFAEKDKNPELIATISSALLTVKEPTQSIALHDFIKDQKNEYSNGLDTLFSLAESKEGDSIRTTLISGLLASDNSGQNGINYLLANASYQFSDLLKFIVAQNQSALNHAFYNAAIKSQEDGSSFLKKFLGKENSWQLSQLIDFARTNDGIRYALMTSLENEPDLLKKITEQDPDFPVLLEKSKKSYEEFLKPHIESKSADEIKESDKRSSAKASVIGKFGSLTAKSGHGDPLSPEEGSRPSSPKLSYRDDDIDDSGGVA